MNQVEICPDAQSPDIDIPCPTITLVPPRDTVSRGPGGEVLPFTGLDLVLLLIGAVVLVALGYAIKRWMGGV
jgi:hypothetical protein